MFYRFLILFFIFLMGCDKIHYYPDRPFYDVQTKLLAHKAGCTYSYIDNFKNTADSSLNKMAGIEVDIQLSKERTLWILHEPYVLNCDESEGPCFVDTYDSYIVDIDSCMGSTRGFTRLESLFQLMTEKYPEKYISIDVKAWVPCKLDGLDITGMMNVMADQIIALTNKYNMAGKVMVECETTTFLKYIKKQSSGIETYLTTLGDFERGMLIALYDGYSGISFKYKFDEEITIDHINLIRKKGLKIQLWTVNSEADIKEAFTLNPDFIQTDNMNIQDSSYIILKK